MLAREHQVLVTYATWKWIWFISALTLIFLLPGIMGGDMPITFSLGMPCMICLTWIGSIAKWQFANPRARLTPNFVWPHVALLGFVLLVMLVGFPLLLSSSQNINPLGPLAYSLLLGGCMMLGILLNRGIFSLPGILIFFSGFPGAALDFWTGDAPILGFLALLGAGMVSYSLWFLTTLHEEMEEYQTLPIASVMPSRLERAEQRKLLGRKMGSQKLMGWLSDQWFARGIATNKPSTLIQYGLSRTSSLVAACFAATAFIIYGIFLTQFTSIPRIEPETTNYPNMMLIIFAIGIPAAGAGQTILQHFPRMAQEIVRPATRIDYIDTLLSALAKRAALFWIATHVAIWVVAYVNDTLPKDNTWSLITQFLIVSFFLQIPSLALCLRLALWKSMFGYVMGLYAIVAIQVGVLSLWWDAALESSGTLIVVAILIACIFALGLLLMRYARGCWLRAELG